MDFFQVVAPVEAKIEGDLLSDVWLETSMGKVSPDRRTALVIEPPDGRIPYTPAGQQRQATEVGYGVDGSCSHQHVV